MVKSYELALDAIALGGAPWCTSQKRKIVIISGLKEYCALQQIPNGVNFLATLPVP
jgi:hypothetical protein